MEQNRTPTRRKIKTYCNQCGNGPDLLTVETLDGVATRIEPDFDAHGVHPADGKVCVKAYGLVQKLYNPHRVLTPLKRTNPKKGMDEDPGWVEITWQEALDSVADKLNGIRKRGLKDENGNPRFAFTIGSAASPMWYIGSFPAFIQAWGDVDRSIGSGTTNKCYHTEHIFGELWHRGFTVLPDTPRSEYIIGFGYNADGAAGGVIAARRHADARARGIKRVQFEPHLSVSGASATEWLAIKTKTDSAVLYAMLHVLLHEHPLTDLDLDFLKNRTASPYLIGPNGFYLRDPKTRKPLIWDLAAGQAVPHDREAVDGALEGCFEVIDAIETGADHELWTHARASGVTGFEALRRHVADRSPEWAAGVCDIPAHKIRRIADEFLSHARVGETVEIDGHTLPFRPVAIVFGKSVNNGWGAYECIWARTVLQTLVGALEVPGGIIGSLVLLSGTNSWDRANTVIAGEDGFMFYPFNPTTKNEWNPRSDSRHAHLTLTPMAGDGIYSHNIGSTVISWMRLQGRAAETWPRPNPPDVWFLYRCNPMNSFSELTKLGDSIARFPFVVTFSYTMDETNHFADIVLPEAMDLESYQLIPLGGTGWLESLWNSKGWVLRQPIVEPRGEARNFSWISNELARRTGLLEAYNAAINEGACGVALKAEGYDHALDLAEEHDEKAVWDRVCKAASSSLTSGEEVHGLSWFKENGYVLRPMSTLKWYLFPKMVETGLRFELPYQERFLRIGKQLANRLHETGVTWWDRQLADYEAMPEWKDLEKLWDDALQRNYQAVARDYPFWLLTTRSMQHAWGATASIQLLAEVGNNLAGQDGILVNSGKAAELGIRDGDEIEVRSAVGAMRCIARLRHGVRPDVVLMVGQWGHWKTPFAKDLKRPGPNDLIPMNMDLIDGMGSTNETTKVAISLVGAGA